MIKVRVRVLGLGLIIPTCRADLVLSVRHIWHDIASSCNAVGIACVSSWLALWLCIVGGGV